jgi:arylformamidase
VPRPLDRQAVGATASTAIQKIGHSLTTAIRHVRKSSLTMSSMWHLLAVISTFLLMSLAPCLSQGTASQEGLSETLEERFDQLDANGDGVLTIEEVDRPRLFRRLDADGNGVVTLREAEAFRGARPARLHRRGSRSEEGTPPQNDGSGMTEVLNIPYASLPGVDPNLLSLDIYRPPSSPTDAQQTKSPVVVMIHGGGWRTGDKANESQGKQKASFFTGHGFVFVSINYRLSPPVRHPAHVEDVAKALAWLADHIASYGGDPKQIFLMGHSAGAHLAALVTTDEAYLNKLGRSPAMVSGVILLDSAAYDIPDNIDNFPERKSNRLLIENAFGKDRETWAKASPIEYVKPGKVLPPFLVFYTDRESSKSISKEFVQALQRAGVPAVAVLVREKNHRSLNRDIGRSGDAPSQLILEFMQGKDPKSFPASI